MLEWFSWSTEGHNIEVHHDKGRCTCSTHHDNRKHAASAQVRAIIQVNVGIPLCMPPVARCLCRASARDRATRRRAQRHLTSEGAASGQGMVEAKRIPAGNRLYRWSGTTTTDGSRRPGVTQVTVYTRDGRYPDVSNAVPTDRTVSRRCRRRRSTGSWPMPWAKPGRRSGDRMNVLVTGAAGFIGRWVVGELLDEATGPPDRQPGRGR